MENLACIQEIQRQGHILEVMVMNCNIHEMSTGCILFRMNFQDQTVNSIYNFGGGGGGGGIKNGKKNFCLSISSFIPIHFFQLHVGPIQQNRKLDLYPYPWIR